MAERRIIKQGKRQEMGIQNRKWRHGISFAITDLKIARSFI